MFAAPAPPGLLLADGAPFVADLDLGQCSRPQAGGSLDGFYMACATSGNQFKNAPLAGQFIRALVEAGDAGIHHDADPGQFTGP